MERIKFNSWKEMYDYLLNDGDLYSPETETYVFGYNMYGSIAYYSLDEDEVRNLVNECGNDEYWSGYLGVGGWICDIGKDYEMLWEEEKQYDENDDNSAYWFCLENYEHEWYDTNDYAEKFKEA